MGVCINNLLYMLYMYMLYMLYMLYNVISCFRRSCSVQSRRYHHQTSFH